MKFTSRLNQLASDHNLMHFFVREKDCLSDAVRDAVGPASSCDGDGNAVGPASDDTVAAQSWRRCLPGIVLVTLSAAGDTVRVSLAYRPGVVLSARRRQCWPRMTLSFQRHLHAITARR